MGVFLLPIGNSIMRYPALVKVHTLRQEGETCLPLWHKGLGCPLNTSPSEDEGLKVETDPSVAGGRVDHADCSPRAYSQSGPVFSSVSSAPTYGFCDLCVAAPCLAVA